MSDYKSFRYFLTASENELINYIFEIGILWYRNCVTCGSITRLSSNGKSFVCRRSFNGRKCKTNIALFYHSIFYSTNFTLTDYFYCLNEWRKDVLPIIVAGDLECDTTTVSRLYAEFRKIFLFKIKDEIPEIIGGVGKVVEFDETLLVKRKYNRGRVLANQKWVVCGAERGNRENYFVEFVPHRSRRYLLPLMQRRIERYSTVITDDWGAYRNLERTCSGMNWNHLIVNHSRNYVNPENGAHTNTAEAVNSVIKRVLRKSGTNNGNIDKLLDKIMEKRHKIFKRGHLFDYMIGALVYYSLFH